MNDDYEYPDNDELKEISDRLIEQHKKAYEVLANA